MTIQQLQYALAVYRAGSISAAAASLFIAQPNLSGVKPDASPTASHRRHFL